VPDSTQQAYPGFSGRHEDNQTRSGIAASRDGLHWELVGWVNAEGMDDRNVILFPERLAGRYAVLRRPSAFVGVGAQHRDQHPAVCISFSDDLCTWTAPQRVLEPAFAWEDNRIGGATPPIKTEAGWLLLYHGVQNTDPAIRRVCYRLGAALLALDDPTRVIARAPEFVMQPETYYERVGLFIPNVIFPTGAVVCDGVLRLYYGVCDTAIALATVSLDALLRFVLQFPVAAASAAS